jgi:PAS domain S-box-containing protein
VEPRQALRQLSALQELLWSDHLHSDGPEVKLPKVAEALALALEVDRVGIWQCEGDRRAVKCLEMYDRKRRRHASGTRLTPDDCPSYFQALDDHKVLAADDVAALPAIEPARYLRLNRVASLLAVPIMGAGERGGLVCLERTGTPRAWTESQNIFAIAATNLVSLTLIRWEREHTERRYRDLRDKSQGLIESLEAIVYEANADDFRFTFVSEQAQRLLGYPPQRFLSDLSWGNLIHPEDRDFVFAFCRKATEEKRNHELEFRMLTAGDRVVWIRDIATVIVENERPVKIRGVLLDITERKNLEDQLRQSQRVEAVGKLAGGIAHDFNNLVTIISGYSQLLLSRLRQDDPLRKDLEEIKKAGERAATLTQQLLAFSRRQVLLPKIFDLNAVLASMDGMLQRLIGEDIDLVSVQDPTLGRVKADPGQMEQVIMNLVVNARDAMPRGGKLTLETTNIEIRESYRAGEIAIVPGRYVMLAVSDTGCGMDPDTQARIFEPFFTTKGPGKGTGLGLSTVYGIVKQSGGYIFAYSEVNRGTTFKIYLPRIEGSVEPLEQAKTPLARCAGSETVLLVEDEPGVRILVRETLRMYGYIVLEARHGYEALLIEQEHLNQIQLLITDVVMPQMSGREVADRLLSARRDLKVLYISGYTEAAVIHHGVLDPGTAFLQKPFSPDDLIRKVRQVLDGDRPQEKDEQSALDSPQ